MDKNKFTKGKWYIEDDAVISDTKDMGNIICLAPIGFNDSMDKWEANALLISKSTEMLEMLQSIIQSFEGDYVLDGEIVDNPYEWLINDYIKAKKLIKELTQL